jgi:nitrogen fixation NifU-like protein
MNASELDEIYNRAILDRARHPRHQHRLDPFDTERRAVNPLCGDRVTLRLRRDGQGRIAAIGYEARACAICLAAADFMAELVPGLNMQEALGLAKDFEQALRTGEGTIWQGRMAVLRLFAPLHDAPSRIGCATLPWQALAHALTPGPEAGDG